MSTSSLRDFLKEKAREQSQRERLVRRQEWVNAVSRLIDQCEAWLLEADPERVLQIVRLEFDKVEAGLGNYTVPGLKVSLDETKITIMPVGRNVASHRDIAKVRAAGRIDISDGARRYILYRNEQGDGDSWVVWDEQYRETQLDQARFEEIMKDLLS
jgi:hypothetical protein